ncbi:carbohydrate ABC transporter permease [Paenibacillus sp. GD4]|uniref:carbohydrate ABC transporter permease n=1 Tax=Paenibacillus sp. GD4 TaxID=3068890 RepID=UPI0027966714|nr:carbohydrate ABC transporter permease [Paenibacillus sp. GD4]MDQ1912673.1 carbohydrate ABC transporter permease [Paenibacillus sp. GD4]
MRPSFGEKLFYGFNYVLLGLFGISCILPILHIASLSLSSEHAVLSGFVGLWPVGFTLDSYKLLVEGTQIVKAFQNSVVITVVGTVLNLLFTILAAYPLSRTYFYWRKPFTLLIVFTMLFTAGLIPSYLLIKSLGLVNTYGALWLPALVSVYNLLVLKTFFENIPGELEDAARIDGCSETRLIMQIMLPLSMPVIATLILFYAVGHWNSFFNVMIYINSSEKHNLTVLVQQMIMNSQLSQQVTEGRLSEDMTQSVTPQSIQSAGVIAMLLPMLLVYPFLQKYFVKGVMIGSIKG